MIERNRSSDSSSIGSDDSPVPYGFGRFALGWAYMLFHLIGSGYVSAIKKRSHPIPQKKARKRRKRKEADFTSCPNFFPTSSFEANCVSRFAVGRWL